MYCFTYGSNMSTRRLQARAPSARFVAVATLGAHRLVFHKFSRRDRSAKCDAYFTCDPDDRVVGVVYDIHESDKPALDRAEGLGFGYDEKTVEVVATEGHRLTARLYYATHIEPDSRPYTWYRHHVLVGAREHGLPDHYIKTIEAVDADEDPNRARNRRELSLYA